MSPGQTIGLFGSSSKMYGNVLYLDVGVLPACMVRGGWCGAACAVAAYIDPGRHV